VITSKVVIEILQGYKTW